MADRRRKNTNWNMADEQGDAYPSLRHGVILAVLMDIRDELQQLNRTLDCYQVRKGFVSMRSIRNFIGKRWPLQSTVKKKRRRKA